MNLLRFNKEVHSIYWIDNFLSNEEIEKIIKYSKSLKLESAKVGNIAEEKKTIYSKLSYKKYKCWKCSQNEDYKY